MWMQIFGAVAQGGGKMMSSASSYANVKQTADQELYDADAAEKQGQNQAALIRRAGKRVLGQQRAGYAASGVQVGEGSAGEVERETVVDTEHDAFQAILSGQRQALALRTQAKLQKIQGKAALTSTLIDPLMSGGGAGNVMSGWKTYKPTYNSQAAQSVGMGGGSGSYGYTGSDTFDNSNMG
jgi:hypothetical protein